MSEKKIKSEISKLILKFSRKKLKKISTKQPIIGGLLDSFEMINFITEFEKKFKIKLKTKDLTPVNFQTLSNIHKLVKKNIK